MTAIKRGGVIRVTLFIRACHVVTSLLVVTIAGCSSESADAEAYYNRGIAHGEEGEYDQEIADYTAAIRLQPDDGLAYYNRGVVYEGKGDQDRAATDYAKAKELGYGK